MFRKKGANLLEELNKTEYKEKRNYKSILGNFY